MAEKAKEKEVVEVAPADEPVEELLVEEPGALDYMEESFADFVSRADVSAVFGEAVEHNGKLILPAAEVVAAMGMGVGKGGGGGEQGGEGDGGGFGGRAFARPVAVIISDEHGVRVEPVVDPTKIALAFFTAIGFMVGMAARMKRSPRLKE